MQKELMSIEEFLDIYGIKRSRFYAETKKFPWLISKLGKRTYIKRVNAEKWLEAIK